MKKKFSASTWLLFLIPSLLGILLFLTPIPITNADGDTEWMVTVAVLANWMADNIASVVPWIMLVVLSVAAIGSLLFIAKKPNTDENVPFFDKLFNNVVVCEFCIIPKSGHTAKTNIVAIINVVVFA